MAMLEIITPMVLFWLGAFFYIQPWKKDRQVEATPVVDPRERQDAQLESYISGIRKDYAMERLTFEEMEQKVENAVKVVVEGPQPGGLPAPDWLRENVIPKQRKAIHGVTTMVMPHAPMDFDAATYIATTPSWEERQAMTKERMILTEAEAQYKEDLEEGFKTKARRM